MTTTSLDLLLLYENGLANCGLEPRNIDYDKLSELRLEFAEKIEKTSLQTLKQKLYELYSQDYNQDSKIAKVLNIIDDLTDKLSEIKEK